MRSNILTSTCLGLLLAATAPASVAVEPPKLRCLVLSPHTDDAEFGLGGFIAQASREGHEIIIVNLTGSTDAKRLAERTRQVLGVSHVECLDLRDGGVMETPEMRTLLATCLDRLRPDIIFATWPVDEHPDHRATGSLAIHYVNAKQQIYVDRTGVVHPKEYCPRLFFYEELAGKQSKLFRPDVYIALSADAVALKKQAMEVYATSDYMRSAVEHHLKMVAFRGLESGTSRQATIDKGVWAEGLIAFPLATGQPRVLLPGQK
jgi:LmbE family N-acetylglucosaminyl deacetylase